MKVKIITKDCIEKNLGIPIIFVRLHGAVDYGFNFLIDTSVKYNLIDTCFYKDWIMSTSEETVLPPTPTQSILAKFPPISAFYQEKGERRVMCKDGLKRVCKVIKIDFIIDDRKYSEMFALDESLCPYFHSKKTKIIAGILGNGFLKKHRWILDYSAK